MEPNKFSAFKEAKKTLEKLKDGVGTNGLQTIELPDLNKDQAMAIGVIIATARNIAILRSINDASISERFIEWLGGSLARGCRVEETAKGSTLSFPILEEESAHYGEALSAIPVYAIEKNLSMVEQSVLVPKRKRLDARGPIEINFDEAEQAKEVAVLAASNRALAMTTFEVLYNILDAHGYKADKHIVTCLEGLHYNNPRLVTNSEIAPSGNYPCVLIEEPVYEKILIAEQRQMGSSGPTGPK